MTKKINQPTTTPEDGETKNLQTKNWEVLNTLSFSEIIDSIIVDISDVAGWFNEIFKNDLWKSIQKRSPEDQEKFRWIQIICAEKTQWSSPTDFKWIDLALESFLENPENKKVIVSFMPKEYLLEHKQPIFNYLLAKKNIKFLRLPFAPQWFADFLLEQNRNEDEWNESYTEYKKIITNYMSSIFHTMQNKIQNFETMDVKQRLESIYDALKLENLNDIKEKQDRLISLMKIESAYLKDSSDKEILDQIAKVYVKSEQDHKHWSKKSEEMMSIIQSWKTKFIVDYTIPWQKYVLLINPSWTLIFASKHLEWHKNIVSNIWEEKTSVLGWWRIEINEKEKIFKIYDRSGDFWKIWEEANKALTLLINSQYTDYQVIIK